MQPLAPTFLARVADERFASITDLEERLRGLVAAGRAAWPEVELDDRLFVEHVAARLASGGDREAVLAAVRAGDLYLACACAGGDRRAMDAFDRVILRPARVALARFEGRGTVVGDAIQALREKLLMRDGDQPPMIAEYGGKGALDGWVKVALMHTALNLTRGKVREVPEANVDRGEGPISAALNPELAFIKAEHREAFTDAFRAALASLGVDERSLLRFYIVDQLNTAAIGIILGVHRATVARWISAVRGKLLAATQARLAERLRLTESEVASLIGGLRSQLEVSLASFLAE